MRCSRAHPDLRSFPTRRSSDLFQLAQSARSRLLAVSRKPAITAEDQAVRNTAGYLAGLIDQQMESATRRLNPEALRDRKSTRLNSSHLGRSYAVVRW